LAAGEHHTQKSKLIYKQPR